MKTFKWINIKNIIVDKYSISPETLELVLKIKSGEIKIEDLPPITTELKSGSYILKDGRHRVTAFKLLGIDKIYAKVYRDKRNLK